MSDIFYVLDFIATNIWHVWPLFLASIILSVLIRVLKLDGVIRRAFNANVGLAILLATLVGAFSPFCSCTVVPVIAGLLFLVAARAETKRESAAMLRREADAKSFVPARSMRVRARTR